VNTAFLRRLLADPNVRAGQMDTGLVERLPPPAPDPRADVDAAAAAALARTLELGGEGDPWKALVGWRIDGPAPLRWRLEPVGGGETQEVVVAGGRVRVGDGPARAASAQWAEGGALTVTLEGERRSWAHAREGELTRLGLDGCAWGFREERVVLREGSVSAGAWLEAPMPGNVLAVNVDEGDAVSEGDVLVVLESMKMELEVVAPSDGVVGELAVSRGERVELGQPLVGVGPAL